jgi:hypothetical protein
MKKQALVSVPSYCSFAVMLVLSSLSTRSFAVETREVAAARELFHVARRAAEANDYATACPKFQESYTLDPAVGTLLNIADCDRRAGRIATAWTKFKLALEQLAADDDRRPSVQRVAFELEQRVPKLTFSLGGDAPTGCSVERDGATIEAESFGVSLPVDPGEHVIVVKAPGYAGRRYEFAISEGQSKEVVGEPGEREPPASAGAMPAGAEPASSSATSVPAPDVASKIEVNSTRPTSEPHPNQAESGQRKAKPLKTSRAPSVLPRDEGTTSTRKGNVSLAYTFGAIGIVGIVVGTATRMAAFSKQDTIDTHCPNKECDDVGWDAVSFAKGMQTVSTVSLIAGTAAIGTGLYFAIASGEDKERRTVAVQTMLLPGRGTGLGIEGCF